jgi:GAF domain-containing protein
MEILAYFHGSGKLHGAVHDKVPRMENVPPNESAISSDDDIEERHLWALEAYVSASRALIRSKTPQALIEQVCKAITEKPPYLIAWMGLVQNDPEKTIKILGVSGSVVARDYAKEITLSWDSTREDGQGPAGQSVRSGETTVLVDTLTDKNFLRWRDRAHKYGIRSVVSIPVHYRKNVTCVLLVYASTPGLFDAYEVRLFESLADETTAGLAKFGLFENMAGKSPSA